MVEGNRHPNLIPFKKGGDPRQKPGSPAFSRRILAHLNVLADTDDQGRAVFDLGTLKALADDAGADHAKAVAAGILSHVRSEGWDRSARQPKFLATLSWLFDRQLGRPLQAVTVEHTVKRTATEVVRDLSGLWAKTSHVMRSVLTEAVRQNPELADVLREVADQAPVDTAAIDVPDGSATWNGNDLVIRSLK